MRPFRLTGLLVNDLGWTALLEAVILGDGGVRHRHARQRGQAEVAALLQR